MPEGICVHFLFQTRADIKRWPWVSEITKSFVNMLYQDTLLVGSTTRVEISSSRYLERERSVVKYYCFLFSGSFLFTNNNLLVFL
jgi:hypothetical protein